MYCSKCGSAINPGDSFCTKCGYSPSTQGAATPRPQAIPAPQVYTNMKGNLWHRVKQGENEKLVKTFTCNRLKSFLLNIDSDGFLSVTNKRVIYWSENRKPNERNTIQSEVPLSDISGVNLYKGKIFSWFHFILMYLFNILVNICVTILLAAIGAASPLAAAVLALVTAFGSLIAASVFFGIRKQWTHPLVPLLMNISSVGFIAAGGSSILTSLLSSPLALLGRSSSRLMVGATIAWLVFWALTSLAYLFTMVMYARRPTFSVTLLSKSAGGAAMKLNGVRNMSRTGSAASKAMSCEPAEDSDSVAYQLGTMISELQENGERAVEKWSK